MVKVIGCYIPTYYLTIVFFIAGHRQRSYGYGVMREGRRCLSGAKGNVKYKHGQTPSHHLFLCVKNHPVSFFVKREGGGWQDTTQKRRHVAAMVVTELIVYGVSLLLVAGVFLCLAVLLIALVGDKSSFELMQEKYARSKVDRQRHVPKKLKVEPVVKSAPKKLVAEQVKPVASILKDLARARENQYPQGLEEQYTQEEKNRAQEIYDKNEKERIAELQLAYKHESDVREKKKQTQRQYQDASRVKRPTPTIKVAALRPLAGAITREEYDVLSQYTKLNDIWDGKRITREKNFELSTHADIQWVQRYTDPLFRRLSHISLGVVYDDHKMNGDIKGLRSITNLDGELVWEAVDHLREFLAKRGVRKMVENLAALNIFPNSSVGYTAALLSAKAMISIVDSGGDFEAYHRMIAFTDTLEAHT